MLAPVYTFDGESVREYESTHIVMVTVHNVPVKSD